MSNVHAQLPASTAAPGNPPILSDVFIEDSSCGLPGSAGCHVRRRGCLLTGSEVALIARKERLS